MLEETIKYMILEMSPYRGDTLEHPEINWNFWRYFDDAVSAGLRIGKAAKHARNETFTDLQKEQMRLGRSHRVKKAIEKLRDYTNEAFLDIQRLKAMPNIDLGMHWTRKYQTIKL